MSNFKFLISNFKFLAPLYFLTLIGLFFYSFTQVDLGLTLTQISFWQVIQTSFQHIGYFERPLSTLLYCSIVLLLFFFYILFLKLVRSGSLSRKQVWTLVIGSSAILALAYNAFSYDLFNYIFDAKIITYYHQNPYEHRALDYPGDPMLSFMHWTHRYIPYGWTWVGITVPLSFLGFGYFLPTLILFKLLPVVSYVISAAFIGKILRRINPSHEMFGMLLFALNPLVIIETLVSGHNDIVMVVLMLVSIYFLVAERKVFSFIFLLLSIGLKYATLFLIPSYLYKLVNKNLSWDRFFLISLVIMIGAIVAASIRTNFQPWYLISLLPFVSLLKNRYVIVPAIIISFASLTHYIPYLYTGNWDPPIPQLLGAITLAGVLTSVAYVVALSLLDRRLK